MQLKPHLILLAFVCLLGCATEQQKPLVCSDSWHDNVIQKNKIVIYRPENLFVARLATYSVSIDGVAIYNDLDNGKYIIIDTAVGCHDLSIINQGRVVDVLRVDISASELKFLRFDIGIGIPLPPMVELSYSFTPSTRSEFLAAMKEAGTPVPPDLLEEPKPEQGKPATTQQNPPAASTVEPAAESGKSLSK